MSIVYSTRTYTPAIALTYWLEVATKAFVRHEFVSLNGPSYLGEIRAGSLDGLGVSAFECDACKVTRRARDIARGDSDDILLCLQLSGKGVFTQDSRQAINTCGSFLLIDTRRPFSITFPERVHSVTFKLSRQALEARLGSICGLTARAMAPNAAVAGLTSGFLSMLPRASTPSRARCHEACRSGSRSRGARGLGRTGPDGAPISSIRSSVLFRLKSVIEAHLREPALRPPAAAAEAGISVRYANALLSQDGFSVERYILHRRLERCRQALEDWRRRAG